jgi:hypothetical protein
MGYFVDGAVLAACIGAYRVYTDRRKSMLHSEWDSYRVFWINLARHVGDFIASSSFDAACKYPATAKSMLKSTDEYIPILKPHIDSLHRRILHRASRFHLWNHFNQLGYLQRVLRIGDGSASLFEACNAWKANLLFTTPNLLAYVKDTATRDYLEGLCSVRDGYAGIVEGKPSEIANLVSRVMESRKDIIQDIRKGHVLDRKAESSVPMVHALRMEIEGYLFGKSGPDPDRSSYIEKAIKDTTDGLLERLFPFLEVIVDTEGETLGPKKSEALTKLAPNVEVFVPYVRLGDDIVGVGRGQNEFIMCPFNEKLLFNGRTDSAGLAEGTKVVVSHADDPSHSLSGTVSGYHGEAIKVIF